ncbi:MAG: coenzyme F420-0:L-glutamate ligase [Candidatus Thorarchaeota archaeon]|nr:coenzyme F420-0:L-glutamate ligase [Candidatus Thorarchaeota archaeon]
MAADKIEIIPLPGIPIVEEGNNIAGLILQSLEKIPMKLVTGDILVIAHTLISKAEGRVITGSEVEVSQKATEIAEANDFDAIQVEIALQESKNVIRSSRALITELENGHICNFSGVDRSNAPEGKFVLLPKDADKSAYRIMEELGEETNQEIAVIISDTEGRPWRKGAINIAVGCAGINAFKYNKGRKDLYDRILQHSLVCQIDQVASAAEMIMGQANEGLPVVIVRGYEYESGEENAKSVYRSTEENLFK